MVRSTTGLRLYHPSSELQEFAQHGRHVPRHQVALCFGDEHLGPQRPRKMFTAQVRGETPVRDGGTDNSDLLTLFSALNLKQNYKEIDKNQKKGN